ncbi:fibronectin type III domain-containing protein [Paenarthrobacter ureafaciens]|uniref:fibronectin type III domain-containing protein n=1 Tax=Paenarthrobacter ureafaciens TaxID=37931 RepID=UPI00140A6BB9|nr:fibronectin type III domain-containing protein [Paenarthrobacter ureafaciens]MCX8453698.1 fibronectin type III domain-containing protein [Paenarthrobacter ureafaciens]MCY0973357.1 fibronectin type III domain-containing protein [Paenarthrobacter ureafaciens]
MNSKQHRPGVPRTRIAGRVGTVAGVSVVLCASSLWAIPAANAVVPAFPDNLVVFPDRDFITVEGYQDRVGQTALVEVTRKGSGVVGSAQGVVSAGEVAFEINHPGGYCWGAGTGLNVTPDILPGDIVSIKFNGVEAGATTVQDAYVTEHSSLSGTTLTVKGHAGSGVNPAQMEQRIVEPALKDTSVGRRDIRAVPGPLTAQDGYSSTLEFGADGTFLATYVFNDVATAEIAAAANGERAMAWEVEDADANRQGLTIAEFGELGGPGMGGCPNGPLQSGPSGPTNVKVAKVGSDLKVNWTPAQAIPGTPPITGYRVSALGHTRSGSEQLETGVRISDPKAAGTTIKGTRLDEGYDVYVVSLSNAGETFPAVPFIPETDSTKPTVTASPNGGSFPTAQELTLTANEQGSDIFYTLDGSDPIGSGGIAAEGAILYKSPIPVPANAKYTYAAIDPSGNVSDKGAVEFTITNDPVPAAPAFIGAPVAGQGTATVSWKAPDPGAPGLAITAYTVQAYTTDGAAFGTSKKVAGDVTTVVYDGLTGDTQYSFTIRAANTNGDSPESAKSDIVTVLGELVANAGPDQNVLRSTSGTPVALNGTGSTSTGATYQWRQVLISPDDPDVVTLTGATTLQPTFTLPVYKYPMTNKPLTFELTVTANGKTKTDIVSITPVPDRVTAGQAQWKSRDFRVTGTSTASAGSITVRAGGPGGTILGTVSVTAAAAPETGGVFTLRLRDGAAPAANPGTVWIESTLGGTAGPITVVNK